MSRQIHRPQFRPRTTPRNPPHGLRAADEEAVFANRLMAVPRARRLEAALDDAVEMRGDQRAVFVDRREGGAGVEGVAGRHEEIVCDPGGDDGHEYQPRLAALASSHSASISSRVN